MPFTVDAQDYMEHHGTKGMKWGVRRAQKKTERADKKWSKKQFGAKNVATIINKAAAKGDVEIDRINSKPQYKGKDFSKDSPLRRKYYEEHRQAYQKVLNSVVKEQDSSSPSGRFKLEAHATHAGAFPTFIIRDTTVKHSFEDDGFAELEVEYDSKGHVISWGWPDEMAQSSMTEEAGYISHFGKKGMKWGVRNKSNSSGLSRTRRAALERNAKLVKLHGQVRDRTGSRVQRVVTAPDRILMGKKHFEKFHNKRISKLNAQSDRINSGKLLMRDRVDLLNTPITAILFEKRAA